MERLQRRGYGFFCSVSGLRSCDGDVEVRDGDGVVGVVGEARDGDGVVGGARRCLQVRALASLLSFLFVLLLLDMSVRDDMLR